MEGGKTMNKLSRILFVMLLAMLTVSTVAAAPSIGELDVELEEAEVDIVLPEGLWVEVQTSTPSEYPVQTVAESVVAVNDPKTVMTVREVVEKNKDYLPAGTVLHDNGIVSVVKPNGVVKLVDTNRYDFATDFDQIVLTDGIEIYFEYDGESPFVKATLKIDALKGEKDLSRYQIMIIDPLTGAIYFIELSTLLFNSSTGEVTAEFPILCVFTLIER